MSSHRVNQAWVDTQLAANTNPHIFVFGHEPAFKAQHSDCLDDYPTNRDTFWAGIEDACGRTYFCGHDHFYDHARVDDDGDPGNDIRRYIVGTAGAPLRNWSPPYDGNNSGMTVEQIYHAEQHGYVLGEIDRLDATLTWMERVGAGTFSAQEVWSYTAVPEPATLLLPALGGLAVMRRKRQAKQAVAQCGNVDGVACYGPPFCVFNKVGFAWISRHRPGECRDVQ